MLYMAIPRNLAPIFHRPVPLFADPFRVPPLRELPYNHKLTNSFARRNRIHPRAPLRLPRNSTHCASESIRRRMSHAEESGFITPG
jgi:hypothetical protein